MKKKKELPTTQEGFEAYRKRFIVASLRRATLYWPWKNEALKAARVDRGMYQCNICKQSYPKKETQVDHKDPIVKLSGFTTWDNYIEKMFCNINNLQVVCKPCHAIKSKEESILRNIHKKSKKTKEKA